MLDERLKSTFKRMLLLFLVLEVCMSRGVCNESTSSSVYASYCPVAVQVFAVRYVITEVTGIGSYGNGKLWDESCSK